MRPQKALTAEESSCQFLDGCWSRLQGCLTSSAKAGYCCCLQRRAELPGSSLQRCLEHRQACQYMTIQIQAAQNYIHLSLKTILKNRINYISRVSISFRYKCIIGTLPKTLHHFFKFKLLLRPDFLSQVCMVSHPFCHKTWQIIKLITDDFMRQA